MAKRKGLPNWGEIVLCTVERVTPYAAWCRLDEYENVEGMIHVSEVAGKWVHDIREFVKVKKQYVAKVVRIDYQKGHINLSLKRVTKYDEKEKMNAFRREQRAEKILEQAGIEMGKTLEQAYQEVGYMLQEKFGELFVAFEELHRSPDAVAKKGLPDDWSKVLLKILEKTFQEKEVVIKADLELKSFAGDGVERIKDILNSLQKATGVTVKYISAPKYRVEFATKDPKNAEKKIAAALEVAVKQIKPDGEGSYKMVK
jgi:translation initiation factor 2 subunit 1